VSPRVARADSAPAPAPSRSAALREEIARVVARSKELDDKSITLARRFATAQQERDALVANGASDAEIAAARERVEVLRREQQELVGARAFLTIRHRELREALKPIAAEEALAAAVAAIEAVDGPVRELARTLRPLVPVMERAVSDQARAEHSVGTLAGERVQLRNAGVTYLADLEALVRSILSYATERNAAIVARNARLRRENAGASTLTPAASADA
jgi:hypothetical protein